MNEKSNPGSAVQDSKGQVAHNAGLDSNGCRH